VRTVLIQPDVKGQDEFREILSTNLMDFKLVLSIGDAEILDVEVVIIWQIVPKFLSDLLNLRLIIVCGSGVDHIINSPDLPRNIPLIRLVDPFLQDRVSDYVVAQIFEHYFPEINKTRKEKFSIKLFDNTLQKLPKIGIMGLGLVGSATAQKLLNIGFDVCGWVKSNKERSIDEIYVGNAKLEDFIRKCDVIICHLPLTIDTKGILNTRFFSFLPNGAFLINVGRGAHLIESDLLLALKTGKLSGACLDVLEVEPLQLDHPFKGNSKIKITPHIAGYIGPETQAPYAAQIISCYYNKKETRGIVNYSSFY
jgi:glyoxylate/hydroxypyruvate reductase A